MRYEKCDVQQKFCHCVKVLQTIRVCCEKWVDKGGIHCIGLIVLP